MEKNTIQKLERTISIEEPKTLSAAELAFYREAALEVIKNNTPEEATRIFLGKAEYSTNKKVEAPGNGAPLA